MDYPELKETIRTIQVQLLAHHRSAPKIPPRVWECCPNASWALAVLVLNYLREDAVEEMVLEMVSGEE